jgi:hypothetical protein
MSTEQTDTERPIPFVGHREALFECAEMLTAELERVKALPYDSDNLVREERLFQIRDSILTLGRTIAFIREAA